MHETPLVHIRRNQIKKMKLCFDQLIYRDCSLHFTTYLH